MSCNPESLSNDLKLLTKFGYKAEKCKFYDMFLDQSFRSTLPSEKISIKVSCNSLTGAIYCIECEPLCKLRLSAFYKGFEDI